MNYHYLYNNHSSFSNEIRITNLTDVGYVSKVFWVCSVDFCFSVGQTTKPKKSSENIPSCEPTKMLPTICKSCS